jgi:oligogalacturonide lyase
MQMLRFGLLVAGAAALLLAAPAFAGIGQRFASEKKIVSDPVTGTRLSFVTSAPDAYDSKIYPTHPQWTADGQWVIFRSKRVANQAFAVNEATGDIVQVTGTGYSGMLSVGRKSMRLFITRPVNHAKPDAYKGGPNADKFPVPTQIVAIDLEKVFADSAAGKMKAAGAYEQVFGTVPAEMFDGHELAIDADEQTAYFRISGKAAADKLPPDTKIEAPFGPRKMGAGPNGIGAMDLKTGALRVVAAVPFQIGHIQTNPWVNGEIVFCWETGGKAPQRTWTVMADGSGLRPLYAEASYDWITHEAVISKDEVAIALMGHRKIGTNDAWGSSATRAHPTGLAIVNLRTRELHLVGQTRTGSGLWHIHGSPDGRWAVGDDFARNLWLIDRHTSEMILLTTGHKATAEDHVHPTFSADSTRIEIQSAMLAADGKSMNICIVPVPDSWLRRVYPEEGKAP